MPVGGVQTADRPDDDAVSFLEFKVPTSHEELLHGARTVRVERKNGVPSCDDSVCPVSLYVFLHACCEGGH